MLPHSPAKMIGVAVLLPALWFVIGLFVTDDRDAYLDTPDIKYQLWFLALHLITLRMTSSLWMRALDPALGGLGVPRREVQRVHAGALGGWANAGALLAAAYFISRDTYMAIHAGPSGMNAFDDPDMWGFADLGHGVRTMMLIIWHVEWVLYGYLLWLQLWTLIRIPIALHRTDFTAELSRLLVRDEYRDFFTLLARTSTLTLVFALGNLLFVQLTGELFPRDVVHIDSVGDVLEQMSDVLSISVLFAMIVAGVFVHILTLRRALTRAVNAKFAAAGDRALEQLAEPLAWTGDATTDLQRIRVAFEAQSTLLRAEAFQREVDALGGKVMRTVLAKAVPVMTAVVKRVAKMQIGAP